jgi:hypothetical protein
MESSTPNVETQDWELKVWAGNFMLALLRFCGSLAVVASLFMLGDPLLSPLYDKLGLLVSIIIVTAIHVFSAVYFTWHYRGKTVLAGAYSALLTGTIYFFGGVVVTCIGLNMTIASSLYNGQGEGRWGLLEGLYLLGGLTAVLIVMKGKRQF